jgi:hypothetical protein
VRAFLEKSPFCTFSCINPGFGGPWGMLWIFFLLAIFIMLQKKAFGQKKIQISCTGSKVPFWQFLDFSKMALLDPCMKFEIFLAKSILLKHYENGKKKKYPKLVPGFMQEKVQKGDLLKKPSRELNFFVCFKFI